MNGWFQFTEVKNAVVAQLFFEVKEDKIVRQVEQYGDCWVYSGDSRSFCRDSEGMAVFGNRPAVNFSSIHGWDLTASQQNSRIELEQGWREIDASEFETAWKTAARLAVHRPETVAPGERIGTIETIGAPTVELQEKWIESVQGVVNACDLRLRNSNLTVEDRRYLEDLRTRSQGDLELRRQHLESMLRDRGARERSGSQGGN